MTRALISILHTNSKRIAVTKRNSTAQPNFRNPGQTASERVAKAWPDYQKLAEALPNTRNQEQNYADQPSALTPPGHQSP